LFIQQEEDEEKMCRVWATCPHCGEEVPYQPTHKEWIGLRNDAIQRLLKAEKVRRLETLDCILALFIT
jgi:hypothetical protein